jgi:branched-chain amino acid transport system substrate-binding protein
MTLPRAIGAALTLGGLSLVLLACRAIVGSLDECSDTVGCKSGLVCRDHLCVTDELDPRCTLVDEGGSDAIVIGVLLPLTTSTGQADRRGVYRRDALTVAFDQLNPPIRQGIRGRSIRAIVCDTVGDANNAAALAEKLIARGVPALLSASSAETLAVANVAIPKGVLVMSSSATSPEISSLPASPNGVRLVWRTAPSDALQGSVLAGEVAGADAGDGDGGSQPTPTVAVIELNNPYGQGLYGAFREAYGGQQTAALYDQGGDVVSAVTRAVSFAPEKTIVIAFPDDAIRIVKELGSRGAADPKRMYFSDSAKSPDLIAGVAAGSLEGALGVAPATAPPSSDAYAWLQQQLSQRYNEQPSDVSYTSNTFDAAMLFALAVQYAGAPGRKLDGSSLAEALGHLASPAGRVVALDPEHFGLAAAELAAGRDINIEGASGHLDFDNAVGEAPAAIEVWRISSGGFVTDKVVEP